MKTHTLRTPLMKVMKYVEERGLTKEDLDKNLILPVAEMALRSHFTTWQFPDGTYGLIYQYYTPDRHPMKYVTARVMWPAGFVERAKLVAPKGRGNKVYYPQSLDWSALKRGARVRVCESALKAVAFAARGIYAVGLNGVWGYSSKESSLADTLMLLPWVDLGLEPEICFDSNLNAEAPEFNEDVMAAAEVFSARWRARFPAGNVWLRKLPDSPSGDGWGADDWLASASVDEWKSWEKAAPLEFNHDAATGVISELNSKYSFVEDIGRYVTKAPPLLIYNSHDFRNLVAPLKYYVMSQGANARPLPKQGFDAWNSSAKRNSVKRIVYEPMWSHYSKGGYVNSWEGFAVEPDDRGGASPWFQVMMHIFKEEDDYQLMLNWFAHLVQKPGVRMTLTPLIYGPQGIGKSRMVEVIMSIFGRGAVKVTPDNLLSTFNSVYAHRAFIVADEMESDSRGKQKIYSKLRTLRSDDDIVVNEKGKPEYVVRNTANWMLITNEPDALPVAVDDRRIWIPEINEEHPLVGDTGFWNAYTRWVDEGGAREVLNELLYHPLDDFDPHAPAPRTEAKEQMYDLAQPPMEVWAKAIRENPEAYVGSDRIVFTTAELLPIYRANHADDKDTSNMEKALAKALKKAQIPQALGGQKISHPISGLMTRFWVLGSLPVVGGVLAWCKQNVRDFPLVTARYKAKF